MADGRLRSLNSMRIAWLCLLCLLQFSFGVNAEAAYTSPPSPYRLPFTEKDFNTLFPIRNPFYTYAAFSQAAKELSGLEIQVEMKGPFLLRISRKDLKTGNSAVVREDP